MFNMKRHDTQVVPYRILILFGVKKKNDVVLRLRNEVIVKTDDASSTASGPPSPTGEGKYSTRSCRFATQREG